MALRPARAAAALLRATSALLTLAACGSGSSEASSGEPPSGDASTPEATTLDAAAQDATTTTTTTPLADGGAVPASGLKKPLVGLLDLGHLDQDPDPDAGPNDGPAEITPYGGSITGIVIDASWAELQPTAAPVLATNNVIDQELAMARAYNTAHPQTPLAVKLRVSGGLAAPQWAQEIDGAPLSLSTASGTVGRWWTPEYGAAWRAFQGLLAAAYDSDPLVREVAITSCAALTDEPFISVIARDDVTTLEAAGYSYARQQACLNGALADYAAWATTLIDYTFAGLYDIDTRTIDTAFTIAVMSTCTVAAHCILSIHNLNNPLDWKSEANVFVYGQILAQVDAGTAQADYQTCAPADLDWCGAMSKAVEYKGMSVELWPTYGGFTTLSVAQVANLAATLATGVIPTPSLCPPVPSVDGGP